MEAPHDYRGVLPFSLLLLFSASVYDRLSAYWQWRVRLGTAVCHVTMVAFLALFAPSLGWAGGQYSTDMLLMLTPMTVLTWSFLFFDTPQLGRVLGLALTLATCVLMLRWLKWHAPEMSLALLLLITCVLASEFSWNVTRLQHRALQEERDARRDPLTDLLNRRAFDEALQQTWPPGVLAVLDIDYFKTINDTYGHESGDRVLRAVADVLLDSLPVGGHAYRWGGEEFVLVLPYLALQEGAALLEMVRREIAQRTFVGGTHITLSAGISVYDKELVPAFNKADAALLRAKRTGRNQVMVGE